jgi:hypothetical protein
MMDIGLTDPLRTDVKNCKCVSIAFLISGSDALCIGNFEYKRTTENFGTNLSDDLEVGVQL